MKVKDIVNFLESWASPSLQEPYDNSGLILGDPNDEIKKALITLDVTEAVLDEAIEGDFDFIIAHHPLIFRPKKRIGKSHWIDRCIRKSILSNVGIYAIHTNIDNVITGVNKNIAVCLDVVNPQILQPKENTLSKLTVFVPTDKKEELLEALFDAGAGNVGNYDNCSFQTEGEGTFRPNAAANPTIGTNGKSESVKESRIEVILPSYNKRKVLDAMKANHPYEEVAYYLTPLDNINQEIGAGMIGNLPVDMTPENFLLYVQNKMHIRNFKYSRLVDRTIRKVAFCGGSGSFLIHAALQQKADAFISADFKYHDFFEANDELLILDIGHYESEVHTKDLLLAELKEKFPNFAFRLSKINTNPINYF